MLLLARIYCLSLFGCCMTLSLALSAQISFTRQTDIPVEAYGNALAFAWAGGLNNPQFSEIDLDNDNILDLFIFDRNGNQLLPLLNSGIPNTSDYTLSLAAVRHFPALSDWALLRDYNCDGAADIFTSVGGSGIRVYRGAWNSDSQLTFALSIDTVLANDAKLVVAGYDIPAIDDLDNDGDLDILAFAQNGGHVMFYRNIAAPCALPTYVLADPCWGDFYESGLTTSLDLDAPCTPMPPEKPTANPQPDIYLPNADAEKSTLHPGSTLLTTDLDGNGTVDLVLGDISFDNLVATFNDGTADDAHVSVQDTLFPAYDQSTHLYIFPAAFEADIDNNGTKDMLVAGNAKVQADHYRCVWLYRNSQTLGAQYSYETDTFLVRDMIDLSRRAAPALFDHNGDGLLDLVVGNYGYMNEDQTFTAALALFENIGTATAPAFRLVSRNYAQVNQQFALPRRALKPAFGDLDNDGDQDMLIGDEDGFLHYFNNQPISGIANWVLTSEQYQGIDIAQNNSPQLTDVDGDGLIDLLVGTHNGIIQYRRNMGTANAPLFNTNTNGFFGGVDVRQLGSPTGHATPILTTLQGERVLIVGSESGLVRLYHNIEGNINSGGLFSEITLPTVGITQSDGTTRHLYGEFSKPAAADLDNDGFLDLIVGINQGGLVWLEVADTTVGISSPNATPTALGIQPNPATSTAYLSLPSEWLFQSISPCRIDIYDLNGKLHFSQHIDPAAAAEPIALSVAQLPVGMYVVQAATTRDRATGKLFRW